MVSATLILNSSLQKIVQRGQITAPKRPTDIRISVDYSIFENGAQKIDFWKKKFVEHGTVMLAIDRNGGSLLIFEQKWPNDTTVSKSASQ